MAFASRSSVDDFEWVAPTFLESLAVPCAGRTAGPRRASEEEPAVEHRIRQMCKCGFAVSNFAYEYVLRGMERKGRKS